jgi:hypothetical protein
MSTIRNAIHTCRRGRRAIRGVVLLAGLLGSLAALAASGIPANAAKTVTAGQANAISSFYGPPVKQLHVFSATPPGAYETYRSNAADSPSRTAAVSARHAAGDTRFAELLALAQVKRAVAWAEVERAWTGQPATGTSWFADQRALGQVKRQVSWKAVHRAAGR